MRWNPVTGIYTLHAGVDLIGFTYNRSSDAGVVTFARYNGAAGNEVRVKHDDGTETRYKHNKSISVGVGQRVIRGQSLGVVGTTGASTGVHCHFETRVGPLAAPKDPDDFMATHLLSATTPSGGGTTPLPTTNGDRDMRVLYNTDATVADDKKRWILGELSAQQITKGQATREVKFWGDPVNVSPGELANAIVLVNARRAAVGLPVVAVPVPDVDEAALAATIVPALIAALTPLLTGLTEADKAAIISGAGEAARTAIAAALSNG